MRSPPAAVASRAESATVNAAGLSLEEVARHAVDFWLTTEDVPKPDNRVTVDRDGNVHLAYRPTNEVVGVAHEWPPGPPSAGRRSARGR